MTLPDERTHALQWAYGFLLRLCDCRIPIRAKDVRQEARWILKHFPNGFDMAEVATLAPRVFGRGRHVDWMAAAERYIEQLKEQEKGKKK